MEIMHKAKRTDNGEWVIGLYCRYLPCSNEEKYVHGIIPLYASALYIIEIDTKTVCVYIGKDDKKGKTYGSMMLYQSAHMTIWNLQKITLEK